MLILTCKYSRHAFPHIEKSELENHINIIWQQNKLHQSSSRHSHIMHSTKSFPSWWIDRACCVVWLPTRTDLSPLGFFLMGYVKILIYREKRFKMLIIYRLWMNLLMLLLSSYLILYSTPWETLSMIQVCAEQLYRNSQATFRYSYRNLLRFVKKRYFFICNKNPMTIFLGRLLNCNLPKWMQPSSMTLYLL